MAKKLLFLAVLLLLVSAQAMTVSCDLRCSLMRASTGCHAMQTAGAMAHCHGMSMEQDKQASVSSSDSCAHSGCRTELTAITKSADQNDAGLSKLLVSAVASLVDPFGSNEHSRTTGFASFSRSESRPLAQRPGSSLRI
jgi:hypothetical protein